MIDEFKKCSKCRLIKSVDEFSRQKDKWRSHCKKCISIYHARPHVVAMNKNRGLMNRYGLTTEQVVGMLEAQGYRCYICGVHRDEIKGPNKWLNVDHNHVTGRVRKMLCPLCNKGIGIFNDDPKLLQKVIEYLNEQK